MSDKNKNKNLTPKIPQKPNFQLWLIVAAVMVLLGLTWIQQRGAVIDITQKRFEDIYLAGDVSKVVKYHSEAIRGYLLSWRCFQGSHRTKYESGGCNPQTCCPSKCQIQNRAGGQFLLF